jgi:hypothetical protein
VGRHGQPLAWGRLILERVLGQQWGGAGVHAQQAATLRVSGRYLRPGAMEHTKYVTGTYYSIIKKGQSHKTDMGYKWFGLMKQH